MTKKHTSRHASEELRRRAEANLIQLRKHTPSKQSLSSSHKGNDIRLLNELEIHQIELEMQNAELHAARNQAETLLEKYTALYDFGPIGYFTLAPSGIVQMVNLSGAKLTGLKRSHLVNTPFSHLIKSTERTAFIAFLKLVFTSEGKQNGDFLLTGQNQTERAVSIAAQRSPDGLECRAMVTDVTARKLADDKLRVSETRYRRLFEAAHDGVLLLDPATRKITDANPFMTKLLGYTHEQLVGRELYEIGLLKDEAASQEMFLRLKRNREVRYENLPLESKTGHHQEVEVVANIYEENGHPVIQCNIRDITARKQAEQALRTSEADYRTLFDLVPIAVYSCDAAGRIQKFNRHAADVWNRVPKLGAAGDLFCGALKLFYPDGRAMAKSVCPMAEVVSGRKKLIQDTEVIIGRPDGSRVSVIVNIRPLLDQKGKITGAINCAYDITSRKQAEQTERRLAVLTASNSKLKQEIIRRETVEKALNVSKLLQSRLLAQSQSMQEQLRYLSHQILHAQEDERKRVSRELHDVIAQTLASINIRLSALKDSTAVNPKDLYRNISRTQLSVQKSVEVVHRFARELRPTALDDLGLIPALHVFMKNFKQETGIQVRLSAMVAVEKISPDKLTVLYRVTQEALTNVARHAHASRVDVSLIKADGMVRLQIKDNGHGFRPDRVLHSKTNQRLGLLGMRERLEMQEGKFTIKSSPAHGTTICAEIPWGKPNIRKGKNENSNPAFK